MINVNMMPMMMSSNNQNMVYGIQMMDAKQANMISDPSQSSIVQTQLPTNMMDIESKKREVREYQKVLKHQSNSFSSDEVDSDGDELTRQKRMKNMKMSNSSFGFKPSEKKSEGSKRSNTQKG